MAQYKLQNLAFFDFTDRQKNPCRGADQEWFLDEWQRKAGCGPTTAATIIAYLATENPRLSPLAQEHFSAAGFVAYMYAVWQHVTPTNRGLHKLELFTDGAQSFAAARGCTLRSRKLPIASRLDCQRPSLKNCIDFMANALGQNQPLAFLNYSNGAESRLDSWHWVPIIALDTEDSTCTILDAGKEFPIDFALWHKTTKLGGGLVALSV